MGLCSGFLSSCQIGSQVYGKICTGAISSSPMKNHLLSKKPIICIGPGTGIAPIRAIAQYYLSNDCDPSPIITIFYGCRREKRDCLFVNEWIFFNLMNVDGTVTNSLASIHIAFSQKNLVKEYVTHKLKEHASFIWDMISKVIFRLYISVLS
jgi:sulfite reductase alpha subunit-like flavoprotein